MRYRCVQLLDMYFTYWPACGWTIGVRRGIRLWTREAGS